MLAHLRWSALPGDDLSRFDGGALYPLGIGLLIAEGLRQIGLDVQVIRCELSTAAMIYPERFNRYRENFPLSLSSAAPQKTVQ